MKNKKFVYDSTDGLTLKDPKGKKIDWDDKKKDDKKKKGSSRISSEERSALIRLASTLEVGSPDRRAILAALVDE